MIKIGFGNRVKPRSFGFVPRYYDPAKEELEERIKKYKQSEDKADHVESMKNRIKTGLRMKHYGDPGVRNSAVRRSNMRLLLIICVLGLAGYVLMSSNKFIALIEAFSK
jgi:hypothetical protein